MVFLSLLLPTGLGVFCNLIAIRVIPPYRARELAAALGTLLGAAAYALFQLGPRYLHEAGPGQFIGLAERLNLSGGGISPVHWLARATAGAAHGNFAVYFSWAGLTAAVSLAVLGISFFLVQEAFYGRWAGSAEAHRRRRGMRARSMRAKREQASCGCAAPCGLWPEKKC